MQNLDSDDARFTINLQQGKMKMKLLDIMKKYDRCLVRESAKLTKIYNMILKESEDTENELDEEVCPDCGNDPCTCEDDAKTNEAEETDESKETEVEDTNECDLIPENDFFNAESEEVEENDMLRNRPHNGHIDDPKGVVAEDEEDDNLKKPIKEEFISAEEFFAEAANADDAQPAKKTSNSSSDEMMSAEEFFAEAEKNCDTDESEDEDTDENESEEIDEDEDRMISAEVLLEKDDEVEKTDETEETDETEDEKKLQESLKSYRRKNHHLFNG